MTATAVITTGRAPRRGPRGGMSRRRPVDWLLLALVVVGALLVLAPFYLVLVNSFKSPVDYATSGPLALPQQLDFGGIIDFWNRVDFPGRSATRSSSRASSRCSPCSSRC